ncbi:MAG: hypothetical protein M3Z11_10895 [Candidatus Dormibacteraeota bacterium]|nr:hypothetical protein [Candidatus Dormibacteraeota bacterium]
MFGSDYQSVEPGKNEMVGARERPAREEKMILFAWRLYRLKKMLQLLQAIRRRDVDHLLGRTWRGRLLLRPLYRFGASRFSR